MTETALPWQEKVEPHLAEGYHQRLMQFVANERSVGTVLPAADRVFAAFEETAFDDVKVVILGQDPYPDPKHATGLAFSLPDGGDSLTMSLHSISASLDADGFGRLSHGDLTGWARQGVLLLNTALTIRVEAVDGSPASISHLEDWKPFTTAVLKALAARDRKVVFVLWGGKAQAYGRLVDLAGHHVVSAVHPAAPGRRDDFVGAGCFRTINEKLGDEAAIAWDEVVRHT